MTGTSVDSKRSDKVLIGGHQFEGKVGKTLKDSEPWWKPVRAATPGSPNVVVILLDDLGFSDFGCYGSEIRTPNIDALAEAGLRFVNYTTVPMCTPARAALMTGMNPHKVGCGWLTHNNPGFPGYQAGEISHDVPTMAELLRAAGYSTYAVGKWHNTADYNVTPGADRSSWPLQRGFDQFYGFLAAETNFFAPGQLIEGNEFVTTDTYPSDYYCSDDWTNKALGWLKSHVASDPQKPFFLYLAHNAPHVPLQAKPEDIEKYAGLYDKGWDAVRAQRYACQTASGLVPESWPLSPRSPDIPAWNELSPSAQKLYARYMEIYAAMVDSIDQNIGRLIAFLRDSRQLDNTLIIITSDNGASSIGGQEGAANIFEKRISKSEPEGLAQKMMDDDRLGGAESYAAYPVGWGNCSNTPFRFYKRTPMNGGIRVPKILHWPKGAGDQGGIRRQWVHVTDILPTILDAVGVQYPDEHRDQLCGQSYAGLIKDGQAVHARSHQHFELEGNRGYIKDGWKIVSLQPPGTEIDLDNWMLFDLVADPTECTNLASMHPGRVADLVEAFEMDAQANFIYPLDNRDNRRVLAVPPFLTARYSQERSFYPDMPTVPTAVISPLIADRDFNISCKFDFSAGNEGVLLALGNSFGGLSLFVENGLLHVVYNGGSRQSETHGLALASGETLILLKHEAKGQRKGLATIKVNGKDVVSGFDMSPTILRLTGEGLDIGCDRRMQVSSRYAHRGAFAYTGDIVVVQLVPGPQAPGSMANRAEREAQLD